MPLRADVIGLELFDKTGHTRFLVPSITVDLSVFSLIMGKPRVSLLQLNDPSLIVLGHEKTRTIATKKSTQEEQK